MRVSIAVVAITLMVTAVGVRAEDVGSPGTRISNRMVIHFADLDLTTEPGARTMLQRIESSAGKACGGQRTFSTYTGGLDDRFEQCRGAAIRSAVERLNAPLVTRLFTGEHPERIRRWAERSFANWD